MTSINFDKSNLSQEEINNIKDIFEKIYHSKLIGFPQSIDFSKRFKDIVLEVNIKEEKFNFKSLRYFLNGKYLLSISSGINDMTIIFGVGPYNNWNVYYLDKNGKILTEDIELIKFYEKLKIKIKNMNKIIYNDFY